MAFPFNLRLVSYSDSKKDPCVEAQTPLPSKMVDEMFDVMEANKGIGLAAPQVGINRRFFVVLYKGMRKVVCNPKLYILKPTRCLSREGCLTIPGEYYLVPRYVHVRVTGEDQWGVPVDIFCHDYMSFIMQHEIDHLNGVCICDKGIRDHV